MTIRITGMNSGLDTESIITELASARSVKVENIKKDQTQLSWKIDAWKELNSKIYSLYTDVLSDMRFDYAYGKKTTKVSNPNAVSVVTSGDAVNGVQSLKVRKMAKTAYLTGAELKVDGKKATKSTKLSEMMGNTDNAAAFKTSLKVKFGNGEEKTIDLKGTDTLDDIAKKFSDAGLNAKFDDATGRFFVSAKESGAAGNFEITANLRGLPSGLQQTASVPPEWDLAALSEADKKKLAESAGKNEWSELTSDEIAAIEADYTQKRNDIIAANGAIIAANNSIIAGTADAGKMGLQIVPDDWSSLGDDAKAAFWDGLDKDAKTALIGDPDKTWSSLTDEEKAKIEEDYTAKRRGIIASNNNLMAQETANEAGTAVLEKLGLRAKEYDANDPNWKAQDGWGTMIKGQDAEIELNGATYTSDKNTFEVNGLTITTLQETGDETVTLTTQQDTDGIYDMIKNFIKKYNELINEMDKLYNAESASKYKPLSSEEKDAMSDTEVEEWEKKIKESLLRRDGTLSSVASAMKEAMLSTSIADTKGVNDGKDIYLTFFGIETLGYFKSKDNEKNAYHINGDSDDSNVKNNEDKLRKAIANDPDTVVEFFKQLSTNLYNALDEKMARTDYSSSFTVYNDKQMDKELKEYESKVKTEQDKLNDYIDRWYKKFSQMEVALSKINSQESSISSLFG